ncbi:GNAT family N-acetyltransferase [Arthrobacter sp. Hz1]
MTPPEDVWPLFGLRILTPRLELNPVRDDQLPGLIDAVLAGIHDPSEMPFTVPWTDAPREVLIRETLKHQWRQRCSVLPDHWTLNFAITYQGRVIGMQDLSAEDLSLRRTVQTGSWLTRSKHGDGLGKEMRAAVLMFAFDYLGAHWAVSEAAAWNTSSLAVSRSLGYTDNGVSVSVPRPGECQELQHVRLSAAGFIRPGWSIAVEGFDAARPALLSS